MYKKKKGLVSKFYDTAVHSNLFGKGYITVENFIPTY